MKINQGDGKWVYMFFVLRRVKQWKFCKEEEGEQELKSPKQRVGQNPKPQTFSVKKEWSVEKKKEEEGSMGNSNVKQKKAVPVG